MESSATSTWTWVTTLTRHYITFKMTKSKGKNENFVLGMKQLNLITKLLITTWKIEDVQGTEWQEASSCINFDWQYSNLQNTNSKTETPAIAQMKDIPEGTWQPRECCVCTPNTTATYSPLKNNSKHDMHVKSRLLHFLGNQTEQIE